MTPDEPKDRIFVALDTQDLIRAANLARALAGLVGGVKLGKEFFTAQGPDGVRAVAGGERLFLDLKFHDIPNTVAGAVRAAVHMRPAIVNVHASGGRAMMQAAAEAAREAAEDAEVPRPLVLAVTVLTSLDDDDLAAVGQAGPAGDQVLRLARLAQESGLDGVVCSPREIAALRRACDPAFVLLVPGIRPDWAARGDQKRVMTPAEALAAGADYLVIGRPITGAEDPAAAARRIVHELAG
ncbi:MAG: orotidine-5'-phosphate decarboxylase [Rhodospirillales bacterium]|nr:orotidine-5'-phosphate decarboxylase [Rhodospirillales bacterium]MDH3792183.1 orotidine-5'-phosphate decarboxylase [Rhodospirillales bacterium]MDH3913827.1 orotidine-5'-phosphate decarboxylase [Rhodospirillales bacterium]MDH3920032.1 orotidine-5'-phosphate decarboxylase [Rhodospirillales bacterium]MDH3968450.1 orotidine-5'-phosphate decarboxylase [Rhodospirillales bacterium]